MVPQYMSKKRANILGLDTPDAARFSTHAWGLPCSCARPSAENHSKLWNVCVCVIISFSVFPDKKCILKLIITTTTECFNNGKTSKNLIINKLKIINK